LSNTTINENGQVGPAHSLTGNVTNQELTFLCFFNFLKKYLFEQIVERLMQDSVPSSVQNKKAVASCSGKARGINGRFMNSVMRKMGGGPSLSSCAATTAATAFLANALESRNASGRPLDTVSKVADRIKKVCYFLNLTIFAVLSTINFILLFK
jgi:hypothetical protein